MQKFFNFPINILNKILITLFVFSNAINFYAVSITDSKDFDKFVKHAQKIVNPLKTQLSSSR